MPPQAIPCCNKDRWQQRTRKRCDHELWWNECKRIVQKEKPLELMTDDEVSFWHANYKKKINTETWNQQQPHPCGRSSCWAMKTNKAGVPYYYDHCGDRQQNYKEYTKPLALTKAEVSSNSPGSMQDWLISVAHHSEQNLTVARICPQKRLTHVLQEQGYQQINGPRWGTASCARHPWLDRDWRGRRRGETSKSQAQGTAARGSAGGNQAYDTESGKSLKRVIWRASTILWGCWSFKKPTTTQAAEHHQLA